MQAPGPGTSYPWELACPGATLPPVHSEVQPPSNMSNIYSQASLLAQSETQLPTGMHSQNTVHYNRKEKQGQVKGTQCQVSSGGRLSECPPLPIALPSHLSLPFLLPTTVVSAPFPPGLGSSHQGTQAFQYYI